MCSSFYQTRPLGPAQPEFINLVLKIHTLLAPRALLHHMQGVETAFGRQRQGEMGAAHIGYRYFEHAIWSLWA